MEQDQDAKRDHAARVTRDRHPVERADAQVAACASGISDHPVVKMTSALSEIADQPPLVALSATVAATGLLRRDPRLARAGLRMLAAHALATGIKSAVKNRVDRSRPARLIEDGEYRMEPGDSDESGLRSFPSGHTAGATAVMRALVREYPAAAAPAGIAVAAVAAALIPKQAHYPSDIAAGGAIGWVSEWLVDAGWRRVERHLPKSPATR